MTFALESPAFAEGGEIPVQHTCDGDNVSPPLRWRDVPDGTRSLVLIVDDPDAPSGSFTHWLQWDIPGTLTELAAGQRPGENGYWGRNDFMKLEYRGPCPPPGKPHHYVFTLHALSATTLGLQNGAEIAQVEWALRRHSLGSAQLIGVYARGAGR